MLLHCLGSGGYFPNDQRHTSCYYLPEWGVVLDAGTGMYRLSDYELPDRLDILLSHVHLDHVFGLTTLLVVCSTHRDLDIHLWGEDEKIQSVKQHLLDPNLFPVPIPATFHCIEVGETIDLPKVKVRSRSQTHPGGSLAFGLRDDRTNIVYATDTVGDVGADFASWADRPDLLIHECYFGNDQIKLAEKTGHTFSDRLVEVIDSVVPKQTLVTHVNPVSQHPDPVGVQQIADESDSKVTLAADRLTLEIPTPHKSH